MCVPADVWNRYKWTKGLWTCPTAAYVRARFYFSSHINVVFSYLLEYLLIGTQCFAWQQNKIQISGVCECVL